MDADCPGQVATVAGGLFANQSCELQEDTCAVQAEAHAGVARHCRLSQRARTAHSWTEAAPGARSQRLSATNGGATAEQRRGPRGKRTAGSRRAQRGRDG